MLCYAIAVLLGIVPDDMCCVLCMDWGNNIRFARYAISCAFGIEPYVTCACVGWGGKKSLRVHLYTSAALFLKKVSIDVEMKETWPTELAWKTCVGTREVLEKSHVQFPPQSGGGINDTGRKDQTPTQAKGFQLMCN